jgi:hypothetical protein
MGEFSVLLTAVGGHGCQRDKVDGEFVVGCERTGCPDCIVREAVRRLKRANVEVRQAEIRHWPNTLTEVRDNLLTGIRKGAFPK